MTKQHRILSSKEKADLKVLLNDYNVALRVQPVAAYGVLFASAMMGRVLQRKLSEIHSYLPLLLLLALIVLIVFLIRYEKQKRLRNGVKSPREIKREIKQTYNINLEQARAILAKAYGPTVLDSLAADNRAQK